MEELISSKIILKTPIFEIEEAIVKFLDGRTAKRWYVVSSDAVCVICIKDGKFILLREYRSASGTVEWRIPSGATEKGEDPKAAAIREVREEIGLEPLDIKHFKSAKRPGGYIKQTVHCFVATRFKENPLPSDCIGEESIEAYEASEAEVRKHLLNYDFALNIGRFLADYILMNRQ